MRKCRAGLLVGLVLGIAAAAMVTRALDGATAPPMLRGTVRAAAGGPLAGVAVSARPDGKTFTRSVFTDENGEFYFPPLEAPFEAGTYQVWAQAVGYGLSKAEARLTSGTAARADFVLNTIEDYSNQVSGSEWLDALPETTRDER